MPFNHDFRFPARDTRFGDQCWRRFLELSVNFASGSLAGLTSKCRMQDMSQTAPLVLFYRPSSPCRARAQPSVSLLLIKLHAKLSLIATMTASFSSMF